MSAKSERKIKEGATPLLDAGEEVIAVLAARPRGATQRAAGSIHLGARQVGKALEGAGAAGLELANPMALALTRHRLVVLKLSAIIGLGIGGKPKEVVSAVPIADVDSIAAKRLGLGQIVTVTVRGHEFQLETTAVTGAKEFAEAFTRARGPVAA